MNKKHYIFIIISLIFLILFFGLFYFYKKDITQAISNYEELINIEKLESNIWNKEKDIQKQETITEKKEANMEFAIIPLNNKNKDLESFYSSLKIEHDNYIDDIIILSENINENPSAFSSPETWKYCYDNDCIKLKWQEDIIISQTKEFVIDEKENVFFIDAEIWKHFKYLNNNFKNKNIWIIFINPEDFNNTEILKNYLLEKYKEKAVLFLTISNLSEIDNEDYKNLHNKKTFYTLNNLIDLEEYKNIEVSCPSCLYLSNSLAFEKNKFPHRFKNNDEIIYYHETKKEENGITINFFWDMIYDRWVSYFLSTKEKYNDFLKDLFENSDTSLDPNIYKKRKLFWTDFRWANMETPVVTEKSECAYTEKEIAFCSEKSFLPWAKDIWFNFFSLANNHSLDWWVSWHLATVKNLDELELDYAWYIRHWPYFEENYVSTWSIRWIPYAWHSYDFTIYNFLTDKYCKSLEEYKDNWYHNFVAVHWWEEYKLIHNNTQEKIAEKLIDCWANLIIWHHPHVIQDIWEYKSVPIIYSLWNFVFDQSWSENTSVWIEALIDYNLDWNITINTQKRNVATKR